MRLSYAYFIFDRFTTFYGEGEVRFIEDVDDEGKDIRIEEIDKGFEVYGSQTVDGVEDLGCIGLGFGYGGIVVHDFIEDGVGFTSNYLVEGVGILLEKVDKLVEGGFFGGHLGSFN